MYKYRRYHPIFGNNQHGWFFTHMCGFYQTLQKVCIVWKKTHMCGFYHTHGISCNQRLIPTSGL